VSVRPASPSTFRLTSSIASPRFATFSEAAARTAVVADSRVESCSLEA
jgi:hypothetical protein